MIYDRYISNKVLMGSLRPQRKNCCSVTAMASAVQSLIEKQVLPDEILTANNWSWEYVRIGKNMDNDTVISGLNKYFKINEIDAKAERFIDEIPLGEKAIESYWEKIKNSVRSENEVLIYHEDNHYTNISGFFEEPLTYKLLEEGKRAFDDRRNWIIIAEHSRWGNWRPIRMIKWYDFKEDLRNNKTHLIIRVKLQ